MNRHLTSVDQPMQVLIEWCCVSSMFSTVNHLRGHAWFWPMIYIHQSGLYLLCDNPRNLIQYSCMLVWRSLRRAFWGNLLCPCIGPAGHLLLERRLSTEQSQTSLIIAPYCPAWLKEACMVSSLDSGEWSISLNKEAMESSMDLLANNAAA